MKQRWWGSEGVGDLGVGGSGDGGGGSGWGVLVFVLICFCCLSSFLVYLNLFFGFV
jgi:hypothetical protein